jgi:imidazolonepropionase-like amidohydrolase
VGKQTRERWEERTRQQRTRWNYAQFQLARDLFTDQGRLLAMMARARVPIMAGTDAGNPYCFAGFGLHDELALMVEAGLTPLAALQAATISPARFLGRTDSEGTISAGKIANLVLLRADPLADIHNTTSIEGVWLQGRQFDRAALDKLLEEAKEQAKH